MASVTILLLASQPQCHHSLAGIKLYCLATQEGARKQLA